MGTTLAQGVSVVMLPILQKIYSPADFGTLNLFISLTTLFTAFSTLKLEYAIVLAKEDTDARNILGVTAIIVIAGSIISSGCLLLFANKLLPGISVTERSVLLLCIPLTVLFSGLYEVFSYWFNRKENYKTLASGKMIQNVSTESYRLFHAYFGSTGGLVVGRCVGYVVSFLFLLKRYGQRVTDFKISIHDITEILKRYKQFPLFTMPTVFVSALSNYVFAFLFIEYYGNNTTGMVTVANQYVALPLGIIAGSFSQVFYKRISLVDDKNELFRLYLKFSLRLIAISLCLVALISLLPNSFPSLFLGPEWDGLMPFVRLTVMWQGVAFVASSLSFIYTRLMKQRVMFLFALLQLTMVYFSLSMSNAFFQDAYDTFLIYVMAQALYYIFTIIAAFFFIKTSNLD